MKFPRWLSLLFVVVLGFMLLQLKQPTQEIGAPKMENVTPENVGAYPEIKRVADAEHWKRAINPEYAARQKACEPVTPPEGALGIKVVPEAEGKGEGASCLQSVRLHLLRWDGRGAYDDETDLTLSIGNSAIAGFDAAVIGLKPGGARTLVIPPQDKPGHSPLYPFVDPRKMTIVTVSRLEESSGDTGGN